jgi:hypothetical protein
MSDHLHSRLHLNDGDVVEVMSDTQANVILTTDSDYAEYMAGRSYRYYGGFFTHFPARLEQFHEYCRDIRGFLWLTHSKSVEDLKKRDELIGWKWWAGHRLSLFD